MQNYYQKFVSYETRHDLYFKVFITLLVFSIYIPVKKVFLSPISFATGQYSDFTTYTLYIFDIASIVGILCFLWNYGRIKFSKSETILIAGLLVLPVFHVEQYRALEYYYAIRLILYICVGALIYTLIHTKHQRFLFLAKIFMIIPVIDSVIAIFQFIFQKSVGLGFLGEVSLHTYSYGIAKIVSHGTVIIRGYGLFPHPNILAATLSIALLLILLNTPGVFQNKKVNITIQIILLAGVIVSVSRGTFLALSASSILLTIGFIRNRYKINQPYLLSVLILISAVVLFLTPLTLSRNKLTDASVVERVNQSKSAWAGFVRNPLIGTGQGTSLLHVEQWGNKHLDPWDKQPIHNYFLLNMSEIGIILTFVLIYALFVRDREFIAYIRGLYKKKQGITLFLVLTAYIIISMLFDHYYATSPIMIALLWISMRASQAYLTSPYGTPDQIV